MYYFTGIQHTKSEDIVIPVLGYENEKDYKAKFYQEMNYAYSNSDFIGITILVFDSHGTIILGADERWE